MEHYSAKDLQEMDKIYRRNLVNSATGYKSVSLVATVSEAGISNVAVFNSVFTWEAIRPCWDWFCVPKLFPPTSTNP